MVVDVRWQQPGVASMMWSWEMVWDESVGRSEGDSIMPWCMVHGAYTLDRVKVSDLDIKRFYGDTILWDLGRFF